MLRRNTFFVIKSINKYIQKNSLVAIYIKGVTAKTSKIKCCICNISAQKHQHFKKICIYPPQIPDWLDGQKVETRLGMKKHTAYVMKYLMGCNSWFKLPIYTFMFNI